MEKDKKKTFSGKLEPTKDQIVSKRHDKINVMFREMRKFDLHVGREMVTFKGRETKAIPKSWLDHKDFKQVSRLFLVKGA